MGITTGVLPYGADPVESGYEVGGLRAQAAQPVEQWNGWAPENPNEFVRGLRSAYGGAKAGVQGFGAMAADVVGAHDTAREWYDTANATAQQAAEEGPTVASYEQALESPGNAWKYLQGKTGEVGPYLLLGAAGGMAGRTLGAVRGLRGAQLANAAQAGAMATYATPTIGQAALEMRNDPYGSEMSPGERALRSVGVGGAQTALEAFVPAGAVNRLATRSAVPVGSMIGRTVVEGLKTATKEGATEVGEDIIGQVHRGVYNPEYQFDPHQTAEAGIGGMVGSAAPSLAHAGAAQMLDKGNQAVAKVPEAAKGAAKTTIDAATVLGKKTYELIPEDLKPYAEAVVKGVNVGADAATALAKVLEPHAKAMGDLGDWFFGKLKENIGNTVDAIQIDNAAGSGTLGRNAAQAVVGATGTAAALSAAGDVGQKIVSKAVDAVRKHLDQATETSDPEELANVAKALSNEKTWTDEKQVSAAGVRLIDEAMTRPENLKRWVDRIRPYLRGQTDNEKQAAAIAAKVDAGEPVTKEEAKHLFVSTQIMAKADSIVAKMAKIAEPPEAKGSGQQSKQGDTFNKAFRTAAANVKDISPEIVSRIADRVNAKTVEKLGADAAIREAINAVLKDYGIDPKANTTYTTLYDEAVPAIRARMDESGMTAKLKAEETSAMFKEAVRGHVEEMLNSKDLEPEVSKQIKQGENFGKIVNELVKYASELAKGNPQYKKNAVGMATYMQAKFGEAGKIALDNILRSAAAEFGGMGDKRAVNVADFRKEAPTLHESAVQITKLMLPEALKPSGSAYPHIDRMSRDIDAANEREGSREELRDRMKADFELAARAKDKDLQFKLNERALKAEDEYLKDPFDAVKEKWVKDGLVSEKNAELLMDAVMKYGQHPERLSKQERRVADHETSANHQSETDKVAKGKLEKEGEPDTSGGVEEENPIDRSQRGFGVDTYDEWMRLRDEENTGTQGLTDLSAPATVWGTNAFSEGGHSGNPGAPVSRHPSGDYARNAADTRTSEYSRALEEAHTKYGHRVAKGHAITVLDWAREEALRTGKTEDALLKQALDALLKHDKERLKSAKLRSTDKEWIEARQKMAEDLTPEEFFEDSRNRNYRYYKMEQHNSETMGYSAEQLRRGYSVRENESPENWAKKRAGVFSAKVYRDSLLPAYDIHGDEMLVDLPRLILHEMSTTQAADITGLGDKKVTPDMAKEILTAFHNVIGSIMTADGMDSDPLGVFNGKSEKIQQDVTQRASRGGKNTGEVNHHFDPNMVIFRDTEGLVKQGLGEAPTVQSTKRFFTLGQLGRIAGIKDNVVQFKNVHEGKVVPSGMFTSADISQNIVESHPDINKWKGETISRKAENIPEKLMLKAERGVAFEGMKKTTTLAERTAKRQGREIDDKTGSGQRDETYDADLHGILRRMVERHDMDVQDALAKGDLPLETAAMLMNDAFAELGEKGYHGDVFDTKSEKYDGVVLYKRERGDSTYNVTFGAIRKFMQNNVRTPRTLEEARIWALEQSSKEAESKLKQAREATVPADGDASPAVNADLEAKIKRFNEETEFAEWKQGDRVESSERYTELAGRLRSVEEVFGKDAPLFDKSEGVGGPREFDRPNTGEDEGQAQKSVNYDQSAGLLKRLLETDAVKNDPKLEAFLRETYDMAFADAEGKLDKKFAEYLEANKPKVPHGDVGEVKPGEKYAPPTTDLTMKTTTLDTNLRDKMEANRAAAAEDARKALAVEEAAKRKEAAEKYEVPTEPETGSPNEPVATVKAEPVKAAPVSSQDAATVLSDATSRPPKDLLEGIKTLNGLNDKELNALAKSLTNSKEVKGTLAEQMFNRLKNNPELQERAGVELKDGKFVDKGLSDTPFSKSNTTDIPFDEEKLAEVRTEVHKLIKDAFGLTVKDELPEGASGSFDKNVGILLSKWANDPLGVARHEMWHGIESLLKDMGEKGENILTELSTFLDKPAVHEWLKNELENDTGALSQLDTPAERRAYAFQKFMEGKQIPIDPRAKTIWGTVRAFMRRLAAKFGLEFTTNRERTVNFFKYVKDGSFARDMENADAVYQGLGEKSGDNAVKTVIKATKPVVAAVNYAFGHMDTTLRDHGIKEYNDIADLTAGEGGKAGMYSEAQRMSYKFANTFDALTKGMTNEEINAFKKTDAFTEYLGAIESYVQEALEEGGATATEADSIVRGLYKRVDSFNSDAISDRFEEFITDLAQHGKLDKIGPNKADTRKVATEIMDQGYYYDPYNKLFPDRPDIAEKWSEKDPRVKTTRLAERAAHIAERARHYGFKDKVLNEKLEAGKAKASLEAQTDMRNYLDAFDGKLGATSMSSGMRKLVGSLLFVNNVRLLPLALFTQMLEPLQMAARKDSFNGSLGTLWRTVSELPRAFDWGDKMYTPDKWEKMALQIGTAPSRIITNTMSLMNNGMHIGGTVGKMNDAFFKFNFMEQQNRTLHIEATKHAVEFILEHADNVKKGLGATDNDGRNRSVRFLKELDLEASDVVPTADGALMLTPKTERAINQWVNEATSHPDPGSNSMLLNDQRFALISQMRRFTFGFSKYVLDRGQTEIGRGNLFPLAPALLALPWIMTLDGIRHTLSGKESSVKDGWDWITQATSRAGLTGRTQIASDIYGAYGVGSTPLEAAAGPSAELFGRVARGAHDGKMIDAVVNSSIW